MTWKTIFRKIGNITSTILFTLLLFTTFAIIAYKAAGGEPNILGYQIKTVLSGSMEPGIQTGSIIAIKPVEDPNRFDKGDVITFQTKDNILITHRIVEVKGDGQQYITKGDNNNAPDPEPVLAQNVIGEYTGWTIPYVGYGINFANSKQGAVLLLILPGMLLLLYACVTIWRALKLVEAPREKETLTDND